MSTGPTPRAPKRGADRPDLARAQRRREAPLVQQAVEGIGVVTAVALAAAGVGLLIALLVSLLF